MITANMHYIKTAYAVEADNGTSWLKIESKNGDAFTLFMPLKVAQAVADAWDAATAPAAPVAP